MPTFERVSHVSFSARDADECADWLIRTLDFRVIDRVKGRQFEMFYNVDHP